MSWTFWIGLAIGWLAGFGIGVLLAAWTNTNLETNHRVRK